MWKFVKIASLAFLLTAGIMSSVQALPESGVDVFFFADSTFTGDWVGESYHDCGTGHFFTGVRTQWSEAWQWSCNDGEYQCWRTICSGVDSQGNPWGCVNTAHMCDF